MHVVRGLARVVVAVALTAGFAGLVNVEAPAVELHGDDSEDRFTGSGGVVLPKGGGHAARVRAAECSGCRWRMSDPCAHMTNPGEQAACLTISYECAPDGSRLLRAFLSNDDGATWEYLGLFCIPPSGPVTVANVEERLQDEFERRVPGASITVQPPRGALPHLPVIFDSGQPAVLEPSAHTISGMRVELAPRASWLWDFGDGGRLATGRPGSRYPDLGVSHTFQRDGAHRVTVRTTWRASYVVDGLGPFDVPEPITQDAQVTVPVGQGRAVLVP